MKKTIISICVILTGYLAFGQNSITPTAEGPKISFEEETHDFGNLKKGGDASTRFKFINTGKAPLIISNAKGSCGCTVPTWSREPIAPGKTGFIHVKYDSKRVGIINKSITISSNATNSPTKILRIKGKIENIAQLKPAPVKNQQVGPVAH